MRRSWTSPSAAARRCLHWRRPRTRRRRRRRWPCLSVTWKPWRPGCRLSTAMADSAVDGGEGVEEGRFERGEREGGRGVLRVLRVRKAHPKRRAAHKTVAVSPRPGLPACWISRRGQLSWATPSSGKRRRASSAPGARATIGSGGGGGSDCEARGRGQRGTARGGSMRGRGQGRGRIVAGGRGHGRRAAGGGRQAGGGQEPAQGGGPARRDDRGWQMRRHGGDRTGQQRQADLPERPRGGCAGGDGGRGGRMCAEGKRSSLVGEVDGFCRWPWIAGLLTWNCRRRRAQAPG